MCISIEGLNGEEFPPLEVLERRHLRQDGIYLLYNSFAIYMFVGRHTDPYYLADIFKVEDFSQIDKNMSEDEIFVNMEESQYLTGLNGLLNSIRQSR